MIVMMSEVLETWKNMVAVSWSEVKIGRLINRLIGNLFDLDLMWML